MNQNNFTRRQALRAALLRTAAFMHIPDAKAVPVKGNIPNSIIPDF